MYIEKLRHENDELRKRIDETLACTKVFAVCE